MFLSRRKLLQAAPAAALPLAWMSYAEGQERAEEAAKPAAAEGKPWTEVTPQSERAIQRGDEWLIKTMHRDGGCGVDVGQPTDIGCTAMVGLALMAQGNTPVEGPRSRDMQRIVSFLIRAAENMPADDIT